MPFLWIVAQLLAGWFVADLFTAVVHLTLDKLYGTRCQGWPLLGRLIGEFREHHDDPALMTRRGFWSSSLETLTASSLAVVFACLGLPWFWSAVAVGAGFCQQVHKYAHRQDCPRWVRGLQRCRLLLSPAQHNRHHSQAFDRNFAILNGWSNPLVNGVLSWLGF